MTHVDSGHNTQDGGAGAERLAGGSNDVIQAGGDSVPGVLSRTLAPVPILRHPGVMATLLTLPPADRHTLVEDIVGLLVGTLIMALAVMVLKAGGLITGQVAGLALLIGYAGGWSFGAVFFGINLPFYVLALRQMGVKFTVKTFAAVALLSLFTEVLPLGMRIDVLHPIVAAPLFGVLAGIALIVLFRHGATLGGIGVVALWLQDTRGVPAGNTQLAFDAGVFALAFALLPWPVVLTSLAGSVILNLMITVNHRGDRYLGRSS